MWLRGRLLALIAAGLAAVAGVALYIHRAATRLPSTPSGRPVPRDAFDAPWTTRPTLLVGLGDSITAGFGATGGYSYFERLVRNPPGEWADMRGVCLSSVFPGLETRNLAVNGSTSLDHATKQLAELQTADARTLGLLVITTGGNDLIHDYGRAAPREGAMYGAALDRARPWIANFEARLNLMLDHVRSCFPGGCHVFLANIYDPTDGVGDIERAGLPPWKDGPAILAACNEAIARCAEQRLNVHLVDLHGAFLGHGLHHAEKGGPHYRPEDPTHWYHANVEDPNDRGYDAIRRLFLLEMIAVLRP